VTTTLKGGTQAAYLQARLALLPKRSRSDQENAASQKGVFG
jgi:hypothetical protein